MAPRPSSHKEPSACRMITKCSNLSVSPILLERHPPGSTNLLGLVDIKSVGIQSLRFPENLRWVIGDNFVPCQDKFRIEAVRGGFVNCLPGKISLQAIFIIAVGARSICLAIRCQHFLLIQHDELGAAPWLTRLTDVSPEEIVSTVK